jgi:hypothetical protein
LHPELISPRDEARAIAVRLLAYIGGIACLAVLAAELLQTKPVVAAAPPAPRPDWVEVERPHPAFMLSLPEIGEEARYAIRRHERGGGRKDIMTFGEPGRSARFLSVEIYRPGTELDRFDHAAAEIAPRAAAFDPEPEVRSALPIDTKFGPVSTVDIPIGGFREGHCVGFARTFTQPRLQISGLFCNAETIVDRSMVACLLDRLSLLSAGSDPNIAGVFAKAEINRQFCRQRDPLLYATTRRNEPSPTMAALKLRGSLGAR